MFSQPQRKSWIAQGLEEGKAESNSRENEQHETRNGLAMSMASGQTLKDFSLARGALSWGVTLERGREARFRSEEFANPGPSSQHLTCGFCGC